MAFRNLTKKFFDIRSGNKVNRSFHKNSLSDEEAQDGGLLKASGDSSNWKPAKDTLPPAWVDKIEEVEEDVNKIQTKIADLASAHTKRLMDTFASEDVEILQEREIDNKTREITDIFHHAENILKLFSMFAKDVNISAAERSVRNNMQRSLAKKLQGLSMEFRRTQKEYMNRLQSLKAGAGNQAFEFLENNNRKPSSNKLVDYDDGFTNEQIFEVDTTADIVNSRDEEIARIATSIDELAKIFKELAVLVIDQGTILDRIDYNMETAVEHAKEGVKQLTKAEDHQKSAMATKCIIALVVLIIIMLGVLIWKHSSNK
eukprot:gene10407-13979_t